VKRSVSGYLPFKRVNILFAFRPIAGERNFVFHERILTHLNPEFMLFKYFLNGYKYLEKSRTQRPQYRSFAPHLSAFYQAVKTQQASKTPL
jgi:hypothetical protein